MTDPKELIEQNIGKMVIRIHTLVAQLNDALEENAKLKAEIAKLTSTEVHANGS